MLECRTKLRARKAGAEFGRRLRGRGSALLGTAPGAGNQERGLGETNKEAIEIVNNSGMSKILLN